MREIKTLNSGWSFTKEGETTVVALPHTWNALDGTDGGNDYYRGTCTYARTLSAEDLPFGREIFLEIPAANSSAEVLLNGRTLATHDGGYSLFRVSLGAACVGDALEIRVDNSANDRVYPQFADFTFYGGLYRGASLIGVGEAHFDLMDHGSSGLYVTPVMEGDDARVTLDAKAVGADGLNIRYSIKDADGKTVASAEAEGIAPTELVLGNAHRWNGRNDPYLYTATAELLRGEEVVDAVSQRFGCRTYEITADRGFILNGQSYPLRGVSRHQDRKGVGNALLPEHHAEDIALILEMGANTVRLAHYQHNSYFYDLCDEKGLVIWAEIPYISKHMPGGSANTLSMMEELIRQNYNHASIVVWGLSNEITMGGEADPDLLENHRLLNDLAHRLDPTRKTTLAAITMCPIDAEYLTIPDVVSYNHYFGWYGGTTDMNGPWFDKFHETYPGRAIGISEYGCEALDWHTEKPAQGDYTEEYQAYYHEELIKQIDARPYLWATHVWNMFDFGADSRGEGGENGMNHKGLVTFDRAYKKDSFYAYKAWLSDEPFVHLCSKRFVNRDADETVVKVYSNQPEVELFANGESLGKQAGKWFFSWRVKNVGETQLVAVSGELRDESVIRKVDAPDESYIFKETGAILNWFEITAPEGRFSLLDSMGDIMKKPRGAIAIALAMKNLMGGKKKGDKDKGDSNPAGAMDKKAIMNMIRGFSVIRMLNLMGTAAGMEVSKEDALKLNKRLNKIRK